jgi:nucleoside-diphosphate-sugar epimerase
LQGVDSVVHLAAEVGVGQSMYEVERYTSTNDVGTAVLFEALIDRPVRRVVTASSMSIYGEGLYRDADGELVQDAERKVCATDRAIGSRSTIWAGRLKPVATPEWKRPNLSSIYALNKYVQERTTHIMGAPYGIESVCLRLFNVYGPGQALSNPYTGVLAIFASRLLNGQQPMIFEDGEQRRDFVHVSDVARAFADALVLPQAAAARSTSVRARIDRSPRSRPNSPRDGQERDRARNCRQGPDRRYPPLLLRHQPRRRSARLHRDPGFPGGACGARRMGRAADRAGSRRADAR